MLEAVRQAVAPLPRRMGSEAALCAAVPAIEKMLRNATIGPVSWPFLIAEEQELIDDPSCREDREQA